MRFNRAVLSAFWCLLGFALCAYLTTCTATQAGGVGRLLRSNKAVIPMPPGTDPAVVAAFEEVLKQFDAMAAEREAEVAAAEKRGEAPPPEKNLPWESWGGAALTGLAAYLASRKADTKQDKSRTATREEQLSVFATAVAAQIAKAGSGKVRPEDISRELTDSLPGDAEVDVEAVVKKAA